MTRTEALEAFFAAVDLHMPQHALAGRSAIRQAGIDYADAAVNEILARWQASIDSRAQVSDDRHLLDGGAASPQPQAEGLHLVSERMESPDTEEDLRR